MNERDRPNPDAALVSDLANMLETVMSSEPNMPTHESTMEEAEAVLTRARNWLEDNR